MRGFPCIISLNSPHGPRRRAKTVIPRRRRGRPSSPGGRRGPGRVPGRAGQVCFIPTLLRGLLRGPLAVPRAQGSSAGCSPLLAAAARFSTFLFLLPLHLPPSLPCRDPHRRPSPRGGWPGSMQDAGSILFHFLDPSQTPPPSPFAVTRGEADPLQDLQPGQCAPCAWGVRVCVRRACAL